MGDLQRESGVCVFSRRQSGLVPIFLSSGVPERTSGSRGWLGLYGWMKTQIRGKTRNRCAAGPNNVIWMKKWLPGASSGRRLEMLLVKAIQDN
jgi:hypothetical protein